MDPSQVILKAVRVPEYCLFVSAFGFRALHCSLAEILEVLGNKVIPCSICREELVQPLALRCRLIPKANEALVLATSLGIVVFDDRIYHLRWARFLFTSQTDHRICCIQSVLQSHLVVKFGREHM